LTINGYIACNAYKGGVTKELFRSFLEDDVLPKCEEFARTLSEGKKPIIIVDNARIHHDDSKGTLYN
jgi:hypothetical protein